MTEIFENIPEYIKRQTECIVELALHQKDLMSTIGVLKNYRETCSSEEEQDFLDFYFSLRMEQLKNENSSD